MSKPARKRRVGQSENENENENQNGAKDVVEIDQPDAQMLIETF
jgi:hypothetical protein